MLAEHLRRLWASERAFLVALGAAAVVRVLVWAAFPPAFHQSDAPSYLQQADQLLPSPARPVGYSLLLAVLSDVSRSTALVTAVQAGLGLGTAALAYALLRRYGVSSRVATIGTLPILFDGMQLLLEHSVLSDVLFVLLVLAAIVSVGWRAEPSVRATAAAGLLLGLATVVRIVGAPVLLVVLVFVLATFPGWRSRTGRASLLLATYLVPLVTYAGWYHHANGPWALAESGGRSLYMRTTTFVDCSLLDLPSYEQALCPAEPVGQRQDPTDYGWHETAPHDFSPPPGMTADEVMGDFARRAIVAQPLDFGETVLRDVALPFWARDRVDHYDYDTAYKWRFTHFVDLEVSEAVAPSYYQHGGVLLHSRHPLADAFAVYGDRVAVPGPALLAMLGVVVAGAIARRDRRLDPVRRLSLLLAAVALALSVTPDVTAQFVWRYQLPLVVLLPLGAALAWTRWRAPSSADVDDRDGSGSLDCTAQSARTHSSSSAASSHSSSKV